MRFSELAHYLERLEATASRNDMTKILAEVFAKAGHDETDKLSYLLLGELTPSYRGVDFQIAEKMMIQILASAYEMSAARVLNQFRRKGDLGDLAYELAESAGKNSSSLNVEDVYDRLRAVAEDAGTGSQERKKRAMADILQALDRTSAKYVARIPVGKMRLGFSEATILDALSLMLKGDKSARPAIERAYNVMADIGAIAKRVKKGGLASLSRLHAEPGTPIRPSLAERVSHVADAMKKAGPEVGLEEKLDGLRMQVHVWHEVSERRVSLFSRNLENTTAMFPEIVAAARRLKVKSIILDGEAIGYYPKTGTFAPFQETVQRKRKHDVAAFAEKLPLSIFVFDLLYLDGKSLLDRPFRERRAMLERTLPREDDTVRLTTFEVTQDPARVGEALAESVGKGLEGLVAKNLDAPYQPGSRGFHWVKLKATTAALGNLRGGGIKGLPDTIDCIVMGAYRGRGKRAAFGVGGFLLGVRGKDGRYFSLSRLGTGLSDDNFREAHRRVRMLSVKEQPKEYAVEKETAPHIWLKPSLVVEILADEITLSPRHTAGKKGADGKGYSLRFPRLVRFRDDKKAQDATTDEEVAKMFKMQKKT
ncbi:MAG: hypothetical protein A3J10_01435 [Candidatus Sungbacteria bacterium RIFCSPLOWO2_02_FULL_54_10]|nr:MAG: hypothetical protein A3J10_01435 [Candidatus Sungbacteria bacterium RIFCSPLOWO2_02_FULL_54_10]